MHDVRFCSVYDYFRSCVRPVTLQNERYRVIRNVLLGKVDGDRPRGTPAGWSDDTVAGMVVVHS